MTYMLWVVKTQHKESSSTDTPCEYHCRQLLNWRENSKRDKYRQSLHFINGPLNRNISPWHLTKNKKSLGLLSRELLAFFTLRRETDANHFCNGIFTDPPLLPTSPLPLSTTESNVWHSISACMWIDSRAIKSRYIFIVYHHYSISFLPYEVPLKMRLLLRF